MTTKTFLPILFLGLFFSTSTIEAQDNKAAVRATVGGTRIFLDEPFSITAGGAIDLRLSDRLQVEPQILFSNSSEFREIHVFGNVLWNLAQPDRRLVPYVIAGAGLLSQTDKRIDFHSSEFSLHGGFGVKAYFSERFFIAPEARLGFHAFPQFTVSLGFDIL